MFTDTVHLTTALTRLWTVNLHLYSM